MDKRDAGIDLVAKTHGTGEIHAIQCNLYAEDYLLQKSDIDSFFTASGKKPFAHRVIVSTTNHWSTHAEEALRDQQPPVSKIDLNDLENSQIDWAQYQPKAAPVLKVKKQLRLHQEKALEQLLTGLQTADRRKLIMACGTGKTFTSLKIAEALVGKGKCVLFLVPSLSLLSQTLTEWTQESRSDWQRDVWMSASQRSLSTRPKPGRQIPLERQSKARASTAEVKITWSDTYGQQPHREPDPAHRAGQEELAVRGQPARGAAGRCHHALAAHRQAQRA